MGKEDVKVYAKENTLVIKGESLSNTELMAMLKTTTTASKFLRKCTSSTRSKLG